MADKAVATAAAKLAYHQRLVFALTYITYASVYFTRKPLSAAKTTLKADGTLTDNDLNIIETSFMAAYAVGQFTIGPLCDRFGARRMLTAGFLGSAASTMAFSTASSTLGFAVFWGFNGLVQAGGYPLIMKALSPWFSKTSRGSVIGFWTTCQQVGGALSTKIPPVILSLYGWRPMFVYVSVWVAVCGLAIFFFLVEDPALVGLRSPAAAKPTQQLLARAREDGLLHSPASGRSPSPATTRVRSRSRNSTDKSPSRSRSRAAAPVTPSGSPPAPKDLTYFQVARLPFLLNLGAAYFLIKLVRYVLIFWLLMFLQDEHGLAVGPAASIAMLLDVGGAFGSILCGVLSDKVAGGRRMFIAAPMCVLTGVGLLLYPAACAAGTVQNAVAITFIGLMVAGPDSVFGGPSCTDVCERANANSNAVTTASGIVNGLGSMGTILQSSLTVYVKVNYGWNHLFTVMAGLCFAAAGCVLPYVLADLKPPKVSVAKHR